MAELDGQRRSLVLADDAARAKHRQKMVAAQERAEDARLALEVVKERLVEARAVEEQDRRRASYDAAKAKSEAAAKRLVGEYGELGRRALALIRVVAEAEAAVEAANASLPDGVDRLASPERLVRSVPGLLREVLHEKRIELWAGTDDVSVPAPAELQEVIRPTRDGFGEVPPDHSSRRGEAWAGRSFRGSYVRHVFIRREVLPAVMGTFAAPLSASLVMPGLRAGSSDIWGPSDRVDPGKSSTAALLSALARAESRFEALPTRSERKPEVEFELVMGKAAARAA